MEHSHLKFGTGYPCAVHKIDKSEDDRFLYFELSDSVEKTGDLNPTGSKIIYGS